MTSFSLDSEWIKRSLDFPEETATFAAVKLTVLDRVLTKSLDLRLNTQRERVHVPTYPLAVGIAREWWTLLHEPDRGIPEGRNAFWSRHRLDAYLPGFLFPAVSVWSGGDEGLSVATASPDDPAGTSPIGFLEQLPRGSSMPRFEVEACFRDLIESTLSRLDAQDDHAGILRDAWDRVRSSLSDDKERLYCEAAGRLGLDPYDADAPDLTVLAAPISQTLFATLCEASTVAELKIAAEYAALQVGRLPNLPSLEIEAFAKPPPSNLARHAAFDGYEAARVLRQRLGLSADPVRAVRQLLQDVVTEQQMTKSDAAPILEGIAVRENGRMRAIVKAPQGPGQRYFRLCRAAYLAWTAAQDGEFGVTVARTRSQQASRTFGAELIAPESYLRERGRRLGFTHDEIYEVARDLECDPQIIRDQIVNHGIGLREAS